MVCKLKWTRQMGLLLLLNKLMIDITKKYQRLFKVGGLRYLICDIWMEYYKRLETLVTFVDDEFSSYLPARIIAQTLEDGAKLHTTENFLTYHKEFTEFLKESGIFFEALRKQTSISENDLIKFLSYTVDVFSFYSKTEFFFTDQAYVIAQQKKDEKIDAQLKTLGDLKNLSREHMNKIFFGSQSYLTHVLSVIASKFNINKIDLEYYSRNELLELFKSHIVSESVLNERKKAFVMHGDQSGNLQVFVGEEALRMVDTFSGGNEEAVVGNTINGIIAHRGKIQGRAKIIRADYHNFDGIIQKINEMNFGDVLVAETTSPELINACKKASAIVTDQGGLLSHAAIISRELNIPCIVGTSNATKMIKDGDMVEVDANTGVVRKVV